MAHSLVGCGLLEACGAFATAKRFANTVKETATTTLSSPSLAAGESAAASLLLYKKNMLFDLYFVELMKIIQSHDVFSPPRLRSCALHTVVPATSSTRTLIPARILIQMASYLICSGEQYLPGHVIQRILNPRLLS